MGAVYLLQKCFRGYNGLKVAFFLGIPAVVFRAGGIIDHHRGAAAHQSTENGESATGRCGDHHPQESLVVCFGVCDIPACSAVNKRKFFTLPLCNFYKTMM
jgi:hypothetical protein